MIPHSFFSRRSRRSWREFQETLTVLTPSRSMKRGALLRKANGSLSREALPVAGTRGVAREAGGCGNAHFQSKGLVFVLELNGQDNGGILEAELADILLGL